MNKIITILLICIGFSQAALGETKKETSLGYISALGTFNFQKAAEYINDRDLGEFKSVFLNIYRAEQAQGKNEFKNLTFGPSVKLLDIEKVGNEIFFAKIVRALMGVSEDIIGQIEILPSQYLGEIEENERLHHSLVRSNMKLGSNQTTKIEIISMIPEGTQWKIILPENFKTMGNMVAQKLGL